MGGNVPKHGYRFGAEVRATMPSAELSAEPVSSAKNEPSSVMPGRGTKKAWLAGATVTAVLLVVITFLTAVREPHMSAVRTSLAVPLTAYRDTSGRRASRPTEAGSPFPGTARRWTTMISTSNWPAPANPCA